MVTRCCLSGSIVCFAFLSGSALTQAQGFNASINGRVTDPSRAEIPDAELMLTAVATAGMAKFVTGPQRLYQFGSLARDAYDLKVSAQGFKEFVQRGIGVNINENVTADVRCERSSQMHHEV